MSPKKTKKLEALVCTHDPRQILDHIDHVDQLEVAWYGESGDKPVSVVVECTRCGCVVQELYDVGWEEPGSVAAVTRTWEDGVKDAALIVQHEMRHKKALDHPNTKVHPAVFETLNEVELHLAAMLSRGSYESRDTVMQGENPRWLNNEVQFARLLWEIVAALDEGQLKALIKDVSASMNLSFDEVNELFDRADQVWEKAKDDAT